MSDIRFVDSDVNNIEKILKAGYERIMNLKVAEGDPINDFIGWLTYLFSISKEEINFTGKMNLLKYAKDEYLDAIGTLVGVQRNEEKGAKATIKYTFTKIFPEVVVIPKGHKVAAGSLYFELDENIELKIGTREVVGEVTCITTGEIGNNFEKGEINTIVDDIPYLYNVENITVSSGGTNKEEDESLRERIHLKPTSFSTAGPVAAYKYYVLTAHQDIVDAEIYTPEETPGVVKIIPLLKDGIIPGEEVLNIVKNILENGVRPFTDNVQVEPPTAENYNIQFKWWLNKEDDILLITPKVSEAVEEYKIWQKQKLGRDINPNKLIQLLIQAGAKRVEITSPVFTKIDKIKIAQEKSIQIDYQGVEDE